MDSEIFTTRGEVLLRGAPDTNIGHGRTKATGLQIMHIEITQDVISELIRTARDGKPPHILFGRTPKLRYGDVTHVLKTSSETRTYELYESSEEDELDFMGSINHTLAVQKVEEVTAATDAALETLKNQMASINQEKEARKAIVDGTSSLTPNPRKRLSAKQHLINGSLLGSRSQPSSPLLHPISSPSLGPAPTSNSTANTVSERVINALSVPVLHFLASRPATINELIERIRARKVELTSVLGRIATELKDGSGRWTLSERAFQKLDVWKFPYTIQEDRQAAIDNAIRSFDRSRLAKEHKLWQMLLPVNERGKGKVLSRLNIVAPPAQKASNPIPKIGKLSDKKSTLARKSEPKTIKTPSTSKRKENKPTQGQEAASNITVKDKPRGNRQESHLATHKNGQPNANTTPLQRPQQPSVPGSREKGTRIARKTIDTKPKNPSPLSASPPVNAADLEDRHPLHSTLSASVSPMKQGSGSVEKNLKRKTTDSEHGLQNSSQTLKHHRSESATVLSNKRITSAPSGKAAKRKVTEVVSDVSSHPTPVKHRKLNGPTNNSRFMDGAPVGSSTDTEASMGSPLPLSFRQTLELSQKFKRYYERYSALYWRIAEATEPPTDQQREDLMKMHTKLAEMKREIKAGAMRH